MTSIDYFVGFTSEPKDIDDFLGSAGFGFRSKDACGDMHYGNKESVFVVYTPADSFIESDYWTNVFKCSPPICAIARVEPMYECSNANALKIAVKIQAKYQGSMLGQRNPDSNRFSVSAIDSQKKHS